MNSTHQASQRAPAIQEAIKAQLATLSSRGEEVRSQITPLGDRIDAIVEEGSSSGVDNELPALERIVRTLTEKLTDDWTDAAVGHVLFQFAVYLPDRKPSLGYVADNVGTWLDNHVNEPDKFNYCLRVLPPPGIVIESVLNAGAEKQVFVARWPEVTPHKVAFKCFHEPAGKQSGDAFTHPLRGHHPNVIETFPINSDEVEDEVYLVERLLPTTLSYSWDFGGLSEIVNLVRDIAHALSFVHGFKRIHGDIKLENIGIEDLYILLDFGLCRSEPAGASAWTPTGNVRGLAPELLRGQANTAASDVWALGSVAFAALTGRPPFFRPTEKQKGFIGNNRDRTLARLANRADDPNWRENNMRLLTAEVPELPLRQLLLEMLDHHPKKRPSAREVFERCNAELPQFLRPVETVMQSTPMEEFRSLRYLQESGGLELAGRNRMIAIGEAVRRIDATQLSRSDQVLLSELQTDTETP